MLVEIAQFETILATPGMPEVARAPILAMLDEKRKKLVDAAQPAPISFSELRAVIAQEGFEFRVILNTYQGYSRSIFGGHEGAANLAGLLLVRELGRRPRRQNNLETMGMISVVYPHLDQVKAAPPEWLGRGYTTQDWRDFLKISLDYFVRGGGSLDVPDIWRVWLGVRFPRNWIVPADKEVVARGQRRWPSARRSKLQGTLVRLLANLLKADVETPGGQDSVDSLLNAAWEDVKKVLSITESGYILRLDELAFAPISQAWVCPFTRRFLDTTLRGVTPYLPRRVRNEIPPCERVELPIYDEPFGNSADGIQRIRRARHWLAMQDGLKKLREDGLWSPFNDRVIELAPYFATAEHSAQQSSAVLAKYEKGFKEGWINLLSCSTTMEMGIDIGGVQQVAMNNVPPHPANYLQRAGRAGRRRETRSTAVTLCKSNPHDQNVFLDTRWAFEAKLPPPIVSLNSAVIVQRHVNAMILAQFLRNLLRSNLQDLSKLTCGWFFDESEHGPASKFIAWCETYISTLEAHIDSGLKQLVRHSIFEGQDTERLVRQSGTEMVRTRDQWLSEWRALLDQERSFGAGNSTDPAIKAIGFQKRRLADEYLLREFATQGFLPAYGFPTFIASFDNTTVSSARRMSTPNPQKAQSVREDNRFQRHDLPSRDLVTALREYAPGSEIVMDGLVYRSAGITLNWHIPANQQDARETQAIKFAWRCRHCGASGTTYSLQLATHCDACGSEVRAADIQQFLEPAGFSVDFYVEPHNDVSMQHFIPVERPWISARGDWSPLPNPNLGRFRSTTDGRVYHHSAGQYGKGYALCLTCGRTEPMTAEGALPKIFEPGQEHKKLRSRNEDRTCSGSTNRWTIKEGIALGHQLHTDVLEIQLKDESGQWITDRTKALTLGVALRDSLASLLGVQATEIGCDVQETRADDAARCRSIFIYDRFAAGYASGAERLINDMLRAAAKRLECPKACDSSCPHCVLDFDQRFEASSLDRHAALAVLTPNWLDMMKLPQELCYLGDSSQVETAGIISAVLRESGRPDVVLTRLFAGGSMELSDIPSSNLRLLTYRLASLSRPVQVIIEQILFDSMTEADRFSLASLADHPAISVGVAIELPCAGGVPIIAEVVRNNSSVAWASADRDGLVPNKSWGVTSPIVTGLFLALNPAQYGLIEPILIRPANSDASDREIALHHEVDGNLQGFGKRLWDVIAREHKGTDRLLGDSNSEVVSIEYSDRYLFTPVSIALLIEIISGLKKVVGSARWDNPTASVTTTPVRGGSASRAVNTVYADWPDQQIRDAVAKLSFDYAGINSDFIVADKFGVQHGRSLVVVFSSGKKLTIRLDQGVTYWRVDTSVKSSRKISPCFDLVDSDVNHQAKLVAEMNVFIEGGSMPTEIFVKIRTI